MPFWRGWVSLLRSWISTRCLPLLLLWIQIWNQINLWQRTQLYFFPKPFQLNKTPWNSYIVVSRLDTLSRCAPLFIPKQITFFSCTLSCSTLNLNPIWGTRLRLVFAFFSRFFQRKYISFAKRITNFSLRRIVVDLWWSQG